VAFSGIEAGGVKPSNCLEYLLLAGGVGRLPVLCCLGEPVDEGLYAKLSRPAKESYIY